MKSRLPVSMAELEDHFGGLTLSRGIAYSEGGHVLGSHMANDRRGLAVLGRVTGNSPRPYDVVVTVDLSYDEPEIYSTCTCPVRMDCKHAAALMVSLIDRRTDGDWSTRLSHALDAFEDLQQSVTDPVPLGIQFDHELRSFHSSDEHRIVLRSVRRGARGTWVKQGVGWLDLRYAMTVRPDFDPSQWRALNDLAGVVNPVHHGQNPDLNSFGPSLWPRLRKAVDTGIELVPGNGLTDIWIEPKKYSPSADIRALDGDVGVVLGLRAEDGEVLDLGDARLEFIGKPAHGVLLVESAEPPGRRRTAHFTVRLVELAGPVPGSAQQLMTGREVIRVPEEERRRFLTEFLPRLRRHVPTISSDDSVDLPVPLPPRLELHLTWSDDHEVALDWSWVYRTGELEQRASLGSHEGLREFRDLAAEAEMLASIDFDDAVGLAGGEPMANDVLTDQSLLDFVERGHPSLLDNALIDVVEEGSPLEYRPATGDPDISFALMEAVGSDNDWLDLSVSITLDGEEVPVGIVLEALTRGKAIIFTPSGRHLRADHPALAQFADLVAAAGEIVEQPDGGVRVGRTDLALWDELAALGVVDAQAEQWVRSARALRELETLPEVSPGGLKSELRPYQDVGLRWLAFLWQANLGGILADDMGLGKTLQALALVSHAREQGAGPFLVIAPTSVVGAWAEQAATHTPGLSVSVVTSSSRRRERSIAELCATSDVVVTSYTLFRLEAAAYREQAWGGLILDEAQQIKNHQGKTYQAVRRLDVPFRLALTGTPFENRLMELWSLLSVVAPGLYPWPTKFAETVSTPVEKHGNQAALDRFRRRIRPFLLRRTKDLVADDLPPKQEQIVTVQLGAKHRRIYDTHLQRERQTVLGLIDDFDHQRIAIFRALTRLRQLSLDPGLIDDQYAAIGSAKLELLIEQLRELAGEGHRALVFSTFTSYLARVRTRLDAEGIAYEYLDGRTRNRQAVIDRFKTGDAPAFLISLKAGGVGLTLTEADYVFVLDPWWNPAAEAQAVDRAHRIGQERPVMVYRLLAEGTIEQKVMELKARKEALFGQVIDGDAMMSTGITAEDVRGLFGE